MEISRETFEASDQATKLNLLYDIVKDNNDNIHDLLQRMNVVEKKTMWEKVVPAVAGLVGGTGIVLGKAVFWK